MGTSRNSLHIPNNFVSSDKGPKEFTLCICLTTVVSCLILI